MNQGLDRASTNALVEVRPQGSAAFQVRSDADGVYAFVTQPGETYDLFASDNERSVSRLGYRVAASLPEEKIDWMLTETGGILPADAGLGRLGFNQTFRLSWFQTCAVSKNCASQAEDCSP